MTTAVQSERKPIFHLCSKEDYLLIKKAVAYLHKHTRLAAAARRWEKKTVTRVGACPKFCAAAAVDCLTKYITVKDKDNSRLKGVFVATRAERAGFYIQDHWLSDLYKRARAWYPVEQAPLSAHVRDAVAGYLAGVAAWEVANT
jgi:hypothetical protein